MLRVVAHKSAAAARQYYAEGLKREDYYSEGQEIAGKWHGKAAGFLGLKGDVMPEAFAALVENRHPGTGEKLTPRTKADRIVGYDFNFHAPKSLSVLHALTGDKEILKAFRAAVTETMEEIEWQTATRVRQKGAQENRITGNLAWAEFVHFTARPVGGIPDPHLHVHCFAFNATFDAAEERWKAGKFRDIKKDAPYSEATFHSRLTEKLSALGYGIERTRAGWEIKGIPRSVIDKFSRRSAQIDRLAAEKGITDPKAKDGLGAATREGKRRGMTRTDLLGAWSVKLTPEEKAAIDKVHSGRSGSRAGERITPAQAFDYACEKLFAKNAVVEQKRLVAEALRFGIGQVSAGAIWREFEKRQMISREVKGEHLCTTLDVLAEEVSLINFVRAGRGQLAPIQSTKIEFKNEKLSGEQKAAVKHILTSPDQVIAVRGRAGVGKTTTMKEAALAIENCGFRIFAFAPSAAASRDTLREAGFANAETIAHLLNNTKLQEKIRGQVLWIDEAGLIGSREMWQIMRLAGDSTKIILTGDAGQHAPVARGDPFRLLQHYSGLKIAELTEIRRQQNEDYKGAVAALSKGDLRTAFQRLDDLGAIVEVPNDTERYNLLAHDFLNLSRNGSPPLVVSPTHAESAKVTAAIREAKRGAGLLGKERAFTQFHNLQWEEADLKRGENYHAGLVVQFHQHAKGINRGESFKITGRTEKGAVQMVGKSGKTITLPLKHASRFRVFEEREIQLARGDRIRITRNGDSANGRRLNNGDIFTVGKFDKKGRIILGNGTVLDAKHGHFAYGYCQTSHSSQSKSVRNVLVAQSDASFRAGSREQFYVSVSRGKESIRIYTDNRQGLQEAVGNSSRRKSGIELAAISSKDISSMSTGVKLKEWRDQITSRTAERKSKNHVRNLLNERRQRGAKKQEGMSWRQYIDMRRGLAGPDGKSRSKSGPTPKGGKKQSIQNRYRSYGRPTSLTNTTVAKMTKADAAKKPSTDNKKPAQADPRKARLSKMYKAATDRLRNVVSRIKKTDAGKAPKPQAPKSRPLQRSNTDRAATHAINQKKAEAGKQRQKQVQAQKIPPPAPKRGR